MCLADVIDFREKYQRILDQDMIREECCRLLKTKPLYVLLDAQEAGLKAYAAHGLPYALNQVREFARVWEDGGSAA